MADWCIGEFFVPVWQQIDSRKQYRERYKKRPWPETNQVFWVHSQRVNPWSTPQLWLITIETLKFGYFVVPGKGNLLSWFCHPGKQSGASGGHLQHVLLRGFSTHRQSSGLCVSKWGIALQMAKLFLHSFTLTVDHLLGREEICILHIM